MNHIKTEPLVDKLATKATIKAETIDKKLGITYLTLSNGVKVTLKPTDFQSDQILVRAFSPGGTSLVSDEKALSAEFVSEFVTQSGLKNFSKVQLDKKIAGSSAVTWLSMNESYEYINGNSNKKDFETMLQLLYLRFTDVNFDKETFDSYINKQKQFFQNLLANPQVYYSVESNKILNQNHPRAFGATTVEQLEKVNYEQVKAVYKERYGDASDFTFVIVGNFEIDNIKPQILKYLGNLPGGNRKEKAKDLGIRTPKVGLKKVINRGLDQKSLVQIRFESETKFDLQEDLYISFLGELLDLKLVEVLREEKSGVYRVTVRGNLYDMPYERFRFFVYFPTGPEKVDSLIDTTFAEIEKIQKGQIDEKDLAKIKEAYLARAKENFKVNQFWATEITRHLSGKYKMYPLEETEARIKAVTIKDLQEIANKYLKKDEAMQIILMPENKTDK